MTLVSARYSSVFLYSLSPLSSMKIYYKCWCCVQGLEGVYRWEAGLDIDIKEVLISDESTFRVLPKMSG